MLDNENTNLPSLNLRGIQFADDIKAPVIIQIEYAIVLKLPGAPVCSLYVG
jgi:hypothetical protein